MLQVLEIVALLAAATAAGSMAFFSAVVAPLVFVHLEGPAAGRLIRVIFPWYYLIVGLLSLLAALALLRRYPGDALLMGLVGVAALVSRQVLMPRINLHRDRMIEGDDEAARPFNRLHRLSVWINAAQLISAYVVLVRLAMS